MLLAPQASPGKGTALGTPIPPPSQVENGGPGLLNSWPRVTGVVGAEVEFEPSGYSGLLTTLQAGVLVRSRVCF